MNSAQKARQEYLTTLADDFGIDRETVYMMADILGPNEDFDGLVTALEDFEAEFLETIFA